MPYTSRGYKQTIVDGYICLHVPQHITILLTLKTKQYRTNKDIFVFALKCAN